MSTLNSQPDHVELGEAAIAVQEDWYSAYVVTRFRDGAVIISRAEDGDSWDEVRLHDLLHSYLAWKLGWPVSPTLWRMAHLDEDTGVSDDLVASEEAAVLRCQRFLIEGR